jgi:hypothetical protein
MKIEWKIVWCVWWSITWRVALYGAISGIVVGLAIGLALILAGHLHDSKGEHSLSFWAGAIFGSAAGIVALKQSLEKNLRELVASANRLRAK